MSYRSPRINIITRATEYLIAFLSDSLARSLETIRIARVSSALFFSGNAANGEMFKQAIDFILLQQRADGGWTDIEETVWAANGITLFRGEDDPAVRSAIQYLNNVRLPTGGWGRHSRDQARITTTALISSLVPEAFRRADIVWLQNEWTRDFRSPVRLSYKAGFYLLAVPQSQEDDLTEQTIAHLTQDQNHDGGFAPWRGHPMGSECWSTGVVLWGLSRWADRVDPSILEKALNWLYRTQLPGGYWPYHYLDDGASLALIGAVAAMKALAVKEK